MGMKGKDRGRFYTDSGIEVKPFYKPEDVGINYERDLGDPGSYPYTRGLYPQMYRTKLWTMRQYGGYGSAEETNKRFKYLLSQGQTGLSVAFDLPTQLGLDSDDPRALGEVGRVGVAISTLDDMRKLFEGIELSKVSTSMTINATAHILLSMYIAVAKEQGADISKIRGTVQNDILKEYVARNTFIYPPEPSLKLAIDVIEYCAKNIPTYYPISISGYHMREAGATAVQELAYTFYNAYTYVSKTLERGLDVDSFAPRLTFFFVAGPDFFEEIAKFRAARRIWARIMREWFDAKNPKSMMLRFHTQTSGAALTAIEPLNNIVRSTLAALSAVLGGTQSLHVNSYDEALSLPTDQSVKLSLRTQQIIAYESGVPRVADPLAGSYYVEWLTNELEERVWRTLEDLKGMGLEDAVRYMIDGIRESAFKTQMEVERGERIIVGVNFMREERREEKIELLKVDEVLERKQIERVKRFKASRDMDKVKEVLRRLREAAEEDKNLMPYTLEAVKAGATTGEVSGVLREVWGEYRKDYIGVLA